MVMLAKKLQMLLNKFFCLWGEQYSPYKHNKERI